MVSNLEKDGAISPAECHNMSPCLCKKLELQKQHRGVTRSFILSGPSVLTQVKDSSQGDIKDKIAKTFLKSPLLSISIKQLSPKSFYTSRLALKTFCENAAMTFAQQKNSKHVFTSTFV